MYLLIPLILILASVCGILFIVWRKLSLIQKLAESDVPTGNPSIKKDWRNVVCDFCPEVLNWAKGIKIEEKVGEYKELWLIEMEKFLRRLRVISLKTDRFSDTLIKKIRRNIYSDENINFPTGKGNKDVSALNIKENGKEELKKAEKKLIMEIAKNPKSAALYEELGDLYAKAGDHRDAKESYEAAIELNPQNEPLKQKLSQTLEKINPLK